MSPYDDTITPAEAAELHEVEEPSHRAGNWLFVAKQHTRTARWEEVYWLVVKSVGSGRTYGLEFREGLTEEQESTYPWERRTEPLPLVRLYPHEVVRADAPVDTDRF